MRLTFAASMRDSYEGIHSAAERMIKYQRQVSTGIRVGQPSDDPSATSTVITEKAANATYEQYTQSGDSAESRLAVADTLLSDIIDKLAAARTAILGVQGSAATPVQLENGAQELASFRDAILEDLTTSFRGTYVFGGAAGTVRPYSKDVNGVVQPYAGSTREMSVDIDRNRPVTVVFDGSAIAQGSDPADLFATFENAIAAARTPASCDRRYGNKTSMLAALPMRIRAVIMASRKLRHYFEVHRVRVTTDQGICQNSQMGSQTLWVQRHF